MFRGYRNCSPEPVSYPSDAWKSLENSTCKNRDNRVMKRPLGGLGLFAAEAIDVGEDFGDGFVHIERDGATDPDGLV